MKHLICIFSLFFAVGAVAEPVTLIVDFDDDATPDDVFETEREIGASLKREENFSAWKIATVVVDSSRIDELIDSLDSDWDIENVEVSNIYTIPENEEVVSKGLTAYDSATNAPSNGAPFDKPNDKDYARQRWHFDMINLEKAWKFSTGKGAVVAILDTGVSDGRDNSHPRIGDLANTCFVEGRNFVDNNDNPYDIQSHGTHVASSVAESTNNKIGGVGVAFNACIMPMKVLSDRGSGMTQDIALAIRAATDNGAHIINMSLGGGGHSQILADAVEYAANNNVLVFCAAGNGSRDRIEYPAAYDGCQAISSVGPSGKLAYYSSHGRGGEGVFIASPGGDKQSHGDDGAVWQSTVNPDNAKQWLMAAYQGTSMATPIAAGSAALLVSFYLSEDGDYDAEEVLDVMAATAQDKNDEYKYGAGILDVAAALESANSTDWNNALLALALSGGMLFVVRRVRRRA